MAHLVAFRCISGIGQLSRFSEIRIAPVDWQHLRGADNACCALCGSLAGEARWTEERLRRVTPSKYSTGLVKEGSEAKVKGD